MPRLAMPRLALPRLAALLLAMCSAADAFSPATVGHPAALRQRDPRTTSRATIPTLLEPMEPVIATTQQLAGIGALFGWEEYSSAGSVDLSQYDSDIALQFFLLVGFPVAVTFFLIRDQD